MAQSVRRFSLFMVTVFLFSVLTVEPEYTQGYQGNNFPVFVESDAVFALCSSGLPQGVSCCPLSEDLQLTAQPCPASLPAASANLSRGPPKNPSTFKAPQAAKVLEARSVNKDSGPTAACSTVRGQKKRKGEK